MTLGLAVVATAARAADWPHWRGPDYNGVSTETGWRGAWSADGPPALWKASVGTGFSSFAVAGGKVFTMGNLENTDTIYCLEADTGKVLWRHSYPADLGDKFFEGGTTGTPTVVGDRVFAASRWGDVFCLEAATGKVVWQRQAQKELGLRVPSWGFSGSPLVLENLVILNIGETGLALRPGTGETVWQSADDDAGYSTPVPLQRDGKWLALFGSAKAYVAVDALTGHEAWRFRWLTQYGVNAADPVVAGDHVFIASGYSKGSVLLRVKPGAEPEVVWKSKVLRTQINGAVLFGGHLYAADGDTSDKHALKCVELATGTEKWAVPENTVGALLIADGKLIVLGEKGELVVAPASPEGFQPTARAQVLGGKCWTVPVLANGRLYCRNSRGDVVCLDLRAK